MEFAAILVLHADGEIDLVGEIGNNSEVGHDLAGALARQTNGLAERRKRASRIKQFGAPEEMQHVRIDAIAPVGDDDDAGSRLPPRRSRLLRIDAREQRGQAASKQFEGFIVERHADDVLEPAFDRCGARGEHKLMTERRFRLKGIPEVEDAPANIG